MTNIAVIYILEKKNNSAAWFKLEVVDRKSPEGFLNDKPISSPLWFLGLVSTIWFVSLGKG